MNTKRNKEPERPGAAMLACVYTVIDAARMAEVVNGYTLAVSDGMANILHCSGEMAAICNDIGSILWDMSTGKELSADDEKLIKKCRDRVDGWISAIKEWDPGKSLLFPNGPTDAEAEPMKEAEPDTGPSTAGGTDSETVREIAELSKQIGVFEKEIDALIFGDLDDMTPAEMRDALESGLDFLSFLYSELPGYPGDDDITNGIKREIWDTREILSENRFDEKLSAQEMDETLDRLSYLNGKLYCPDGQEDAEESAEPRQEYTDSLIEKYKKAIGDLALYIAELNIDTWGDDVELLDALDAEYIKLKDEYEALYEKNVGQMTPEEKERIAFNHAKNREEPDAGQDCFKAADDFLNGIEELDIDLDSIKIENPAEGLDALDIGDNLPFK